MHSAVIFGETPYPYDALKARLSAAPAAPMKKTPAAEPPEPIPVSAAPLWGKRKRRNRYQILSREKGGKWYVSEAPEGAQIALFARWGIGAKVPKMRECYNTCPACGFFRGPYKKGFIRKTPGGTWGVFPKFYPRKGGKRRQK